MKNYSFNLLLGSEAFSFLGQQVYFVAVALLLNTLNPNVNLATIIFYNNLFFLLSLFFLFFLNGVSKKKILVISNFLRGFVALAVSLYLGGSNDSLFILVLSAVFGVGRATDQVTRSSYEKELFNSSDLTSFNHLRNIITVLNTFIGPLLGQYLANTISPKFGILFNAVSFILVGVVYLFLVDKGNVKEESFTSSLKLSFSKVQGISRLIILILLDAVSLSLVFGVYRSIVPNELNVLFNSSSRIGEVFALFGLGSVLSSFFVKKIYLKSFDSFRNSSFVLIVVVLLAGACQWGLPVSSNFYVYLALTFALGVLTNLYSFLIFSFVQSSFDSNVLNKIFSLKYFLGTLVSLLTLKYIDSFLKKSPNLIVDLKNTMFVLLIFILMLMFFYILRNPSKKVSG